MFASHLLHCSTTPRRSGYTLVELLVVVLICSILAAAAIPKYTTSLLQFRVDAASKRVAADIAFAQRQAMVISKSQSIVFNLAGNKSTSNTYSMSTVQYVDSAAAGTVINLAKDPFNVSIASATFGSDTTLIFDRFGAPDSAGSVVLQAGSYQKTVSVEAVTGRVTIQ